MNNENQTLDPEDRSGKYLTFKLGDEEYGIAIQKVREIIGMMDITQVPQSEEYVKGVINLRGKVIPVIDLRKRFLMQEAEYTDRTCIIVLEIVNDDGFLAVGMVVDGVSEVLNLKEEQIDNPISFSNSSNSGCISGMAKVEKGVKILLNIDKVFSAEDVAMIADAA